ncbi:MAG: ATP-binding protein [Pseudomonadota bacterium]
MRLPKLGSPQLALPKIRRLRDITPRGLYWRSLLIIILPIALMQIAVTYAFFDSHWRQVSRKLSEGVAGDLAFLVALHEKQPEQFAEIAMTARETTRLSVVVRPDDELPTAERRSIFSALDRTLQRELSEALDAPFWFDTTRYPDYIDIRIELEQGVVRALAYRDRAYATTGHIFVLWIAGATALLTLVAVLFIRNQVRPIEKLAQAADAYGRGVEPPEFKPSGAREVRLAAHSVMRMRDRIRRYADQRTAMLAGVSHDLRTPLTRLKLELALLKDVDTQAAKDDIAEMEAMLEGYLDFARGEEGEKAELTELADLAKSAATAAQGRIDLTLQTDNLKPIKIRPLAIKRALSNLINNASDHANSVRVAITQTPNSTTISVEDDGPGIPDDQYDEALRPFGRLDAARNQNVSGVGLGLSIARDAARAHGGDIELSRSIMGGLKAAIRLPRRADLT